MQAEILAAREDVAEIVQELRRLVPAGESVSGEVAEILATVRAGGDQAVREYTARLDTGGVPVAALAVPAEALRRAAERLDPEVRDGLELAIANVRDAAGASLREDRLVRVAGAEVTVREVPVDSAGVYVPGGRAAYPSTVVMGVVTAAVAGVKDIAVCAPPGREGEVHPVIMAACELTGVGRVFRMGGAQAIAALAYGTESVRPVDMIVGPGSLWVQEAKRQVSDLVAIDGFAGPSDLLVIADPGSDPEPIALDLLAQAEHGTGTLVLGASPSSELLEAIARRIGEASGETAAVARLIEVRDQRQALALAQAFAPEHLQLIGAQAESLAPEATHAGCVFVGAAAATAFGDYIAGSNHILPTGGTGRFASGLSARSFRRSFTEVRITDPRKLARAAAPLARAEGFELHAQSMEIRENQMPSR